MFQVGNVCSVFERKMCSLSKRNLCSRSGISCVLYMEGVFLGPCVLNLEGIMSSMLGTVFCVWKEYVSSIRNVGSSF